MAGAVCAQNFSHTAPNGIPLDYSTNKKSTVATLTNHGTPCAGDLIIPASVKYKGKEYSVISIGPLAFATCKKLTSVTISTSVTSIGRLAFFSCSGLTGTLTIPGSIASIGNGAFSNCNNLTSLTLPATALTLGDFAFEECDGLMSITSLSPTPPKLGNGVFDGVSDTIPVYVPRGSEAAYRAANGWKRFSNIQAISHPVSVAVEGNVITVHGALGVQVRIFDMQGRLLSNQRVKEDPYHFRVVSAGSYLVQIDDGTAHRVVVQPQ